MLAAILKDIWSKIFIESEPVDKEEQDDDLEGAVFHLGGAFDSLIGVQGGRQLSHLLRFVGVFSHSH